MKPIRVLLADDHALIRAGLRALLHDIAGIEVVAEASDGAEALALIAVNRPDIVLMDISMGRMNGLEATARAVEQFPGLRVIVLSMHDTEEYVCHALRAGAAGYLLKDTGAVELELALRSVSEGGTYLSPAVSRHLVSDYVRRTGGSGTPALLTPRQREVLRLIAEGHTTKQIARLLRISVKTVETHRAQLMGRLGIHEIAGLVRYAIREGVVTAEEEPGGPRPPQGKT
jgi:DNA-binding NarL/FixJ family response regulator